MHQRGERQVAGEPVKVWYEFCQLRAGPVQMSSVGRHTVPAGIIGLGVQEGTDSPKVQLYCFRAARSSQERRRQTWKTNQISSPVLGRPARDQLLKTQKVKTDAPKKQATPSGSRLNSGAGDRALVCAPVAVTGRRIAFVTGTPATAGARLPARTPASPGDRSHYTSAPGERRNPLSQALHRQSGTAQRPWEKRCASVKNWRNASLPRCRYQKGRSRPDTQNRVRSGATGFSPAHLHGTLRKKNSGTSQHDNRNYSAMESISRPDEPRGRQVGVPGNSFSATRVVLNSAVPLAPGRWNPGLRRKRGARICRFTELQFVLFRAASAPETAQRRGFVKCCFVRMRQRPALVQGDVRGRSKCTLKLSAGGTAMGTGGRISHLPVFMQTTGAASGASRWT